MKAERGEGGRNWPGGTGVPIPPLSFEPDFKAESEDFSSSLVLMFQKTQPLKQTVFEFDGSLGRGELILEGKLLKSALGQTCV